MPTDRTLALLACSLAPLIGCSRHVDPIQSSLAVAVPTVHASGRVPDNVLPQGTASVVAVSASADPIAHPGAEHAGPLNTSTPLLFSIPEGDMKWVRGLRRMGAFRVFDLARVTVPALGVNWLVYPSRKVHTYPNEREDYPGNYVRKLELVVSLGDASQSIALGEHRRGRGASRHRWTRHDNLRQRCVHESATAGRRKL